MRRRFQLDSSPPYHVYPMLVLSFLPNRVSKTKHPDRMQNPNSVDMKSTVYVYGLSNFRVMAMLCNVIPSADYLAVDRVAANHRRHHKEDDEVDPGYGEKSKTDEFYFSAKHFLSEDPFILYERI